MKSKQRFLKNLVEAERDLSHKYGDFSLFAACFRENTLADYWDLVVAASWLFPETMDSYAVIMDGIRRNMEEDEVFRLGALPLLDPNDPRVQEIQDEHVIEHGLIELDQCQLFDTDMEHVYIITAKRRGTPVNAEVV